MPLSSRLLWVGFWLQCLDRDIHHAAFEFRGVSVLQRGPLLPLQSSEKRGKSLNTVAQRKAYVSESCEKLKMNFIDRQRDIHFKVLCKQQWINKILSDWKEKNHDFQSEPFLSPFSCQWMWGEDCGAAESEKAEHEKMLIWSKRKWLSDTGVYKSSHNNQWNNGWDTSPFAAQLGKKSWKQW